MAMSDPSAKQTPPAAALPQEVTPPAPEPPPASPAAAASPPEAAPAPQKAEPTPPEAQPAPPEAAPVAQPAASKPAAPKPAPKPAAPQPPEAGAAEARPAAKPAPKPAPKPAAKPAPKAPAKPAPRPTAKTAAQAALAGAGESEEEQAALEAAEAAEVETGPDAAAAAQRPSRPKPQPAKAGPPPVILYEDDELVVVHHPNDGEPTLITFADLTFRPKDFDIWAQEPMRKLGVNAIGLVAKRENWFPAASVQAAAPAVRAALRGPAITYGYSMGGYGALKYARLLGAERAFAVCPQTSLIPHETPWDTRFHRFYRPELHAGMAIAPGDAGDFAVLLADPYMPEDARQAQRISQEAGVHWLRTPFMDHASIWLLTGGDFLSRVLQGVMAADRPALTALMRARRHTSRFWFRHAGNAAFRHNHIELANRLWLRALELGLPKAIAEQDTGRALRERMRLLRKGGDHPAARDLALLQGSLRPESYWVQAQVGHALLGMGEVEAAEGPFRAALAMKKDLGHVYQGLSLVLGARGRMADAIALCKRGVEAAPEDHGLRVHLGQMQINAGRLADAEASFRAVLEASPRHSKALLGMSHCLAARGQREEAIEVARAMIAEAGEGDAQAHLWLGQLLLYMGEPEEAEPVFREAVTLEPQSGAAHLGLIRALERSGFMEEARHLAMEAVTALPADAKLQAIQRRLGPPNVRVEYVVEEEGEARPSLFRRLMGRFRRRG